MFGQRLVSNAVILIASLGSLALFSWPLFAGTDSYLDSQLAQTAFIILMPLLLLMVLVEVSSGSFTPSQLALLAVLIAMNAVIRMFGAGLAGVETVFFLIIIASYVFRSSFGFVMGALSLFLSALITGGVGPWLPFQMMAAGLVGLGAGALPKFQKTWWQVSVLISYAIPASFVYGALMTLWNWPFLAGVGSSLSYIPGAGVIANLERFWQYQIFTGGLLWDTGRAVTTSILIFVTAPALLATLRRAARRASVDHV